MKSKKLVIQAVVFAFVCSLFFLFVQKVLADNACGSGSTCGPTFSYLRITSCSFDQGTQSCVNGSTTSNATANCPSGSNSPGSCTVYAIGVDGCTGNTPSGGTCNCTTSGASCTGIGSTCSGGGGTCRCSGASCGVPQGSDRGCCYSGGVQPTATPGGGGGGGGCSSNCSSPQCGQSDGCGGTCTGDGVASLSTPSIVEPTDGSTTNNSTVNINWGNVANAADYKVQVFPCDLPLAAKQMTQAQIASTYGCNLAFSTTTTQSIYNGFAGSPNTLYSIRVIARQDGQLCPSSSWGGWQNVTFTPICCRTGAASNYNYGYQFADVCSSSGGTSVSTSFCSASPTPTPSVTPSSNVCCRTGFGPYSYNFVPTGTCVGFGAMVVSNSFCTPTATPTPSGPSCTLSLPSSGSVPVGGSSPVTASVSFSGGTFTPDYVKFTSSNTGIFSLFPTYDYVPAYSTSLTGVSSGVATLTAGVYQSGVLKCSDTMTVNTSACSPSCATACGQSDGCGGFCDDSDDLPPPAPTLVSPADGASVQATGASTKTVQLRLTKQASTAYNAYYTYIEVLPDISGASCASSTAFCGQVAAGGAAGSTVTYNFTISAANYGKYSRYKWRAYHKNNTCTLLTGPTTNWSYFTLVDTVSGTILRDDGYAGLSGGVCTSPFAPVPYNPQGGEQVIVSNGGNTYPTTINSNGTYSVLAPVSNTGTNTVDFNTSNPSDVCGCPSGCSYSGIDSPKSNVNFYYQPYDIRDPWWQVIAGNVFAGRTSGQAISSSIPVDTCIGVCRAYLSVKNDDDTTNSSGAVLTGGGNIDTSNTAGYQTGNIDEEGRNFNAVGTSIDTLVENYSYFFRLYSMGPNPTNDLGATPTKPTGNPSNGRAYYRNGNMTINTPWNLTNSESKVVFVQGDLTINTTIGVPEGGFLAFIVSGNITFGQNVCQSNPDSTAAVIQGVFVADGTITVQNKANGDCKFVADGIYTAWQGFSMARDYSDGGQGDYENAHNPVEVFRFRPDFVVNIPSRMTRPMYEWQEVAP